MRSVNRPPEDASVVPSGRDAGRERPGPGGSLRFWINGRAFGIAIDSITAFPTGWVSRDHANDHPVGVISVVTPGAPLSLDEIAASSSDEGRPCAPAGAAGRSAAGPKPRGGA